VPKTPISHIVTVQFTSGREVVEPAMELPQWTPITAGVAMPLPLHGEVATMTVYLLRSRFERSAEIPGSLSSSSLPPSFTPGRCATDLLQERR